MFNVCRASPFGKVIDPELCAVHAEVLVNCFEEARDVHPPCMHEFKQAKECINSATSTYINFTSCDQEIDQYQNCFHPSFEKYRGYEALFKTN